MEKQAEGVKEEQAAPTREKLCERVLELGQGRAFSPFAIRS